MTIECGCVDGCALNVVAEVGIEDSLTWWRAARARRKAGIPLDTPIPLLPSSPLPRHPSYSLSVAGEQKTPARDDDEGSDEYLRPVKEGSASSDDEAIPEVDLLLRRPKFKPLPPSAERTRIFSEQSYSEDTTTTVDSRMSFQRVSDSRRPTVTRAPESAQRTPEAGAITQCWYAVSDALACFRRCYFAEDTSPGDRYIKPVPLMIMHVRFLGRIVASCMLCFLNVSLHPQRYYPNVPDRESGLEFVLPPLAEVVETPVAKKSKGWYV